MMSGWNASLPAGTGVCVVKTLEAETSSSACLEGQFFFIHQHADALDGEERGVAFVHVADRRLVAERGQRPHAADAQQHFLPYAHVLIAAVEPCRDLAILGPVRRHVGVHQVQQRCARPAPSRCTP